jgi:thiol-disulfide isomerase/thioredoxin
MKELFINLALLLVFSIAFSSFTACTSTTNSSKGPAGEKPQAGADTTAGTSAEKKPSTYPPIAAAVAQADIKNLDGSTFKIQDRKGEVLLLNLWATWCSPCRAEMPALVRMQDEHRDQNFKVIGINADDESVEDINKFVTELKLNYEIVWGDSQLQNELLKISRFDGIPQSFLIDRDGNLRAVFRGANPVDVRKMEDLVAKVVAGDENASADAKPEAKTN